MRCKACNKYFQPDIYYDKRTGKSVFTELCGYCASFSSKKHGVDYGDIFSEYNDLINTIKEDKGVK